jgi:hypothetical protein
MRVTRGVMKKQGLVTAVFHSKDAASRAYEDLIHKGYDPSDIVIVMSQETHRVHYQGKHDPLKNTMSPLDEHLSRPGASRELPSVGLVVAGPFATDPALNEWNEKARSLFAAAGIEADRTLIYEPEVHAGGVLMGVLPNGPTDRYTIGYDWRRAEGELILGDDEDF